MASISKNPSAGAPRTAERNHVADAAELCSLHRSFRAHLEVKRAHGKDALLENHLQYVQNLVNISFTYFKFWTYCRICSPTCKLGAPNRSLLASQLALRCATVRTKSLCDFKVLHREDVTQARICARGTVRHRGVGRSPFEGPLFPSLRGPHGRLRCLRDNLVGSVQRVQEG